ncbi:MAG: hypothetical protein QXX94_03565 [Candidatus Bathyarchaeia archaeon]
MFFTKILTELESEVASIKWKKEILRAMLNEGKFSQSTFNVLNNIVSEVETAAINLIDKIEESKKFWENMASEETRILESLLVDLRFKNLIGELDEWKWRSMSATIELGIDSISAHNNKMVKSDKNDVDLKTNSSLKKRKNNVDSKQNRRNRVLKRREERFSERLLKPKSSDGLRCMNPWKPNCRRTDIKLSIYYNGQFLPICYECWKEISEKNIEFTG